MKKKHLLFTAIIASVASMLITSCNKNTSAEANTANKQEFSLYLTDAPARFDKVLIDIKAIKVLVDTGTDTRRRDSTNWNNAGANEQRKDSSLVWQTLTIKPGVYDVLALRNGADTLLSAQNIPKGAIRLIKIEIGTNNSVVKDSISYPVALPANFPGYVLLALKGNECEEFRPGRIRLWLDFDIQRSIVQDGQRLMLRPFFKFYTVAATASIAGTVLPGDALAVITVQNSTDTAYAIPDKDGRFKIRGMKDGTYNVFINASNGYIDSTIKNVVIKSTAEASLGTIKLRK